MKKLTILLSVIVLFFAKNASADDTALPVTGYLQLNYSSRVTQDDDYILAEERLQLEFTKDTASASFFVKTDFVKDELDEENGGEIDIREANLTIKAEYMDFKIGKQIATWGVGDLLFINDVFPKDWVSLLAGRPLQYLKVGTTSLKIGLYGDFANADLIVTPFFEEDVLPDGERLFYYAPSMPDGVTEVKKVLPEKDITNSEASLKLSKNISNMDVSLYLHKTHWRTPHTKIYGNTAEIYYPELAVYGASMQGSLFGGIAKLEGGFYHSLEDKSGTYPLIKNSEQRYLAGFEKEMFTDFNLGVQYYTEIMADYNEYGSSLMPNEPKRDEIRQVISLRITQFMLYQTLKLSIYTQYSPTDEDYYINPEVKYNISDNLYAAVGANIFDGENNYTMYGQFDKNDNIYTQLRYDF